MISHYYFGFYYSEGFMLKPYIYLLISKAHRTTNWRRNMDYCWFLFTFWFFYIIYRDPHTVYTMKISKTQTEIFSNKNQPSMCLFQQTRVTNHSVCLSVDSTQVITLCPAPSLCRSFENGIFRAFHTLTGGL